MASLAKAVAWPSRAPVLTPIWRKVLNLWMADETPPVKKNRIVYFTGNFNEEKAQKVVTELLQFECEDPTKDILLVIDSYGGQVDSFIAIHDAIQLLRSDVATLCMGKAMSCGQMLLISGKKGKRFITTHSRVMVHQISSCSWGRLTDMENDVEEGKRLQKIFDKLILKYTKIKMPALREILKKDSYLDAADTVRLGFADHVVGSPASLFRKIKI